MVFCVKKPWLVFGQFFLKYQGETKFHEISQLKYWLVSYMHGSILYFFLKLSFRKLIGIFSQNFRSSSYPIVKKLNDVQMVPIWKKIKKNNQISQFVNLTKSESTLNRISTSKPKINQFREFWGARISILINCQILANENWSKFKYSLFEICLNLNLANFERPNFKKTHNFGSSHYIGT